MRELEVHKDGMTPQRQTLWLAVGIGSIALVVGYMVGASSTPVVSVAAPAVFGLVITAVGLLGGGSADKKLDALKELLTRAKTTTGEAPEGVSLEQVGATLASVRQELSLQAARLGKMLVVFALFYVLGLSFGTYARVTNLYAPHVSRRLPWDGADAAGRPPTPADAIDWINLQEQLLALGYTQEQIADIYSIQVEEWKKPRPAPTPTPAGPELGNTTMPPAPEAASQSGGGRAPKLPAGDREASGSSPRPFGITVVAPPVTLPNRRGPQQAAGEPPPPPTLRTAPLPTPRPSPRRLP